MEKRIVNLKQLQREIIATIQMDRADKRNIASRVFVDKNGKPQSGTPSYDYICVTPFLSGKKFPTLDEVRQWVEQEAPGKITLV